MIKKLSLLSFFMMLSSQMLWAQTTVFAYVKDAAGHIIENADVDLSEQDEKVSSDKIGYFQFVDLQPGTYQLIVSKLNYETKVIPFTVVAEEKRKDLGVIQLGVAGGVTDGGVSIIDDTSSDDDGGSMQPTIGLLNSGRDVFQNVTAFELGAYWFRPRGVDNRFEDVLFNGVSMSKNDDGKVDFSNWAGLNDVTRYPYEYVDNITPSEYTFGNLGGVVYYSTRASSYRKQTSLAYSFTNRSYFHRVMATYSTGLSKKGWAFTFSGSRRWAEEGVIDGTQQNSYAYFAAIEKQFSSRHAINVTAFGAPTYRANNAPNTQEVYDLMGKNYNSYWGWQDGEKRNSRIRKTFEPVFQITDYLKLGKTSNWTNTLSYQFGSDSRSRLDWYHASDPNPTYYRNLPSYKFASEYAAVAAAEPGSAEYQSAFDILNRRIEDWRGFQNMQIDWMFLYNANRLNTDANGVPRGAVYTVVEDVNKDKTFNFVSHFDTKLQSNWKLNLNFNYQNLNSDNFRRIGDLLGAQYAYNLNAFNKANVETGDVPYNIDDANFKVYKGDRTQYSYILNRNTYSFNASTEIDFPKWNVVGSVFSSYSESYREGDYRSYYFPNNSKGKSATYTALDAGIKGKITYKINGKNFIVYNGAFFSLAPTLNEIFINPRVVDYLTPGVTNQIINSNDLSYILRGQIIKLRLTAYYTTMSNSTEIARYYADVESGTGSSLSTLVNEAMTGVNKRYMGVEMGLDVKITPTLNANAVASVGDYEYTNNASVSTFDDLNNFRGEDRWLSKANVKGYKVAGTPQKAFTFGLRYNSPKYWWVGATANYLMDQYLDFSALNKTKYMYTDPATNDPYPDATPELISSLTAQRKFDDQFMLNANAGKSFYIGKYRMGVSVSVNNILNNRNYVTGGFEQGRNINFTDALADSRKQYPYFSPKLWYDRGTTFFANVYVRF